MDGVRDYQGHRGRETGSFCDLSMCSSVIVVVAAAVVVGRNRNSRPT